MLDCLTSLELINMRITKDVLLREKAALQQQIADLQVDITAKDGALQIIEGLLAYLTKLKPKDGPKL